MKESIAIRKAISRLCRFRARLAVHLNAVNLCCYVFLGTVCKQNKMSSFSPFSLFPTALIFLHVSRNVFLPFALPTLSLPLSLSLSLSLPVHPPTPLYPLSLMSPSLSALCNIQHNTHFAVFQICKYLITLRHHRIEHEHTCVFQSSPIYSTYAYNFVKQHLWSIRIFIVLRLTQFPLLRYF